VSDTLDRARRFQTAMGGRTFADVAEAVGVAASTIHGYADGKIPNADKALAVCDVLNLDLSYWINGSPKENAQKDICFLPWRNSPDGQQVVPYAASLIEMLEKPLDSLFCGFGTGNLMAPTIPNGAEVIFTTDITRLNDGCVYLMKAGDGEVVRRLRIRMDGKLEAFCDNREFASQVETVRPDDLIAEAIWVSRKP
jgi:transcriptional regulator with XRE-family HTH domain